MGDLESKARWCLPEDAARILADPALFEQSIREIRDGTLPRQPQATL